MNINIKKIISVLSVVCIFSFLIFQKYNGEEITHEKFYILQVGAYSSYDNVIKNTKNYENYIIHKENDLYKIFIGITGNEKNYQKILNTYANNINTYKKEVKVTDEAFIKSIKEYDKVISNTNNKNNMNLIIKEELKLLQNLLERTKEK